jgi:taurine dioxygenase
MSYQAFDVKPIAGALGAEILGIDLSRDLGNQEFDEIHQAFLDNKTLCFRDQNLTPDRQVTRYLSLYKIIARFSRSHRNS